MYSVYATLNLKYDYSYTSIFSSSNVNIILNLLEQYYNGEK